MQSENDLSMAIPDVNEVYQRYEVQRRLGLIQFIGPIFGLITGILTIYMIKSVYGVQRPQGVSSPVPAWFLIGGYSLSLLGVALFFVSGYIAWLKQVTLASITIAVAVVLTFVILTSVLVYYRGLSPNTLVAYIVVAPIILVVGVTGTWQMLAFVTFLTNIYTTALTNYMPRAIEIETLMRRQAFQINLIVIVIEWSLALVLFALLRVTNQTITRLRDITLAYERSRRLDDLKNQFITSVNHELRTPVMVVQSNLQLLQVASKIMTPQEQQTLIDAAVKASDNLGELITSILDSRNIDQSKNFKPTSVNLLQSFQTSVSMIPLEKLDPQGRDLYLSLSPELHVWADNIRLQQIFVNLLTNAVKYSDPGTKIEVTAEQILVNSTGTWPIGSQIEEVEIRVRDYGFGIPPDQIPLLFQRFVRLPRDLASTISGNGLGLYLCRTFTESMGGRIWVESSGVQGEGSTFFIHLPAHPPASSASSPEMKLEAAEVK
jgi:signal transduction histidine kinase